MEKSLINLNKEADKLYLKLWVKESKLKSLPRPNYYQWISSPDQRGFLHSRSREMQFEIKTVEQEIHNKFGWYTEKHFGPTAYSRLPKTWFLWLDVYGNWFSFWVKALPICKILVLWDFIYQCKCGGNTEYAWHIWWCTNEDVASLISHIVTHTTCYITPHRQIISILIFIIKT